MKWQHAREHFGRFVMSVVSPAATNVATCTTALNAFLNVAVLDPAAVADDVTFAALLKHLVRTDSEGMVAWS
jgi:hypothetical protein